VCYTYRPPSSRTSWLTEFFESMKKCYLEQKECIVLGDLNFDILRPDGSSRVMAVPEYGLNLWNPLISLNW